MIGIAETGSGKTCSFGIPLVHHVLSLNDSVLNSVGDEGPLAIVMAPTRELALQIDEEICKLLSETVLETLAIIGGTDVEQQAYKLRKGVHIIVGTPGRMQDVLESSYLVLNQCTYIVLDEADRMLDMGFEPQITSILEAMGGQMKAEDEAAAYEQEARDLEGVAKGEVPKHRLTAMFSATMPPDVERLARTFLRYERRTLCEQRMKAVGGERDGDDDACVMVAPMPPLAAHSDSGFPPPLLTPSPTQTPGHYPGGRPGQRKEQEDRAARRVHQGLPQGLAAEQPALAAQQAGGQDHRVCEREEDGRQAGQDARAVREAVRCAAWRQAAGPARGELGAVQGRRVRADCH